MTRDASGLIGRAGLLARVRDSLAAHRNLLLVGPAGVGKSALIQAALEVPRPSTRGSWPSALGPGPSAFGTEAGRVGGPQGAPTGAPRAGGAGPFGAPAQPARQGVWRDEAPHVIIDPFEHISPLRAARIRHQLDRRQPIVAAARTLDRRELGAVGRILWRFEVVRVGVLSSTEIRRLLLRQLTRSCVDADVDHAWLAMLVHESRGLPGRACAFAEAALGYRREHGAWPATEWVVVEALVGRSTPSVTTPRAAR